LRHKTQRVAGVKLSKNAKLKIKNVKSRLAELCIFAILNFYEKKKRKE
jgi:hypothetical protein